MISIIIPVYNEEGSIGQLLQYLHEHANGKVVDIIVVDGGSTDATVQIAQQCGAHILHSHQKGRAFQMHLGVEAAKGSVLYFIHADVYPPPSFVSDILNALNEGADLGRYRTRFNSSNWLLKINAWFTRFDWFICYGGDQTLFIRKELYHRSGGFDASLKIMEEYEFVPRVRNLGYYKILKGAALVSARKYDKNSWWTVQQANRKAVSLFRRGVDQDKILQFYKNALK